MADNANLTEKLSSMERANGRLIQQLDGVSLVSDFQMQIDSNNSNTDQPSRNSYFRNSMIVSLIIIVVEFCSKFTN